MKITLRPIDSIKPYPGNPRQNDAAVTPVAASLKEFGFRKPIVVDRDGVIICGHTCHRAAEQLGLAKVPVHVAEDLTPEQVKAFRIADNKLGELADWDNELLKLELDELQQCNVDLGLLGFSSDDLAALVADDLKPGLIDEDDLPPVPPKATTQRGDIYQLGDHRLMCGDSSSPSDLDLLLAGESIHLVNTDPPYNVKVEPRSNNAIAAGLSSFAGPTNHQQFDAARKGKKPKAATELRAKDRPLANDFVSEGKFDQLLAAWFGNIARVLVPGRAFYVWGGYANVANYPAPLKACGLYFSQAIIWVKNQPVLCRKDFMGNHEWCFYGWREGAAHQFYGAHNVQDVWHVSRAKEGDAMLGRGLQLESIDGSRIEVAPPYRDNLRQLKISDEGLRVHGANAATDVWQVRKVPGQQMVHLTEKPVELATRAMQLSSRPGENVLDLFGGSGSTLIGAEQSGRKAFLMELDPLYCDVIVKRWELFTGRKAQLTSGSRSKSRAKKVV